MRSLSARCRRHLGAPLVGQHGADARVGEQLHQQEWATRPSKITADLTPERTELHAAFHLGIIPPE